MVSLFDYLGRAAGADLGKEVAQYAKQRGAKFGTREVSNKKYNGIIMLYEKEFLDEFFKNKQQPTADLTEINTKLQEDSYKNWDPAYSNNVHF